VESARQARKISEGAVQEAVHALHKSGARRKQIMRCNKKNDEADWLRV